MNGWVTCRQSQKRDGKIPEAIKLHRHLLHGIPLNQMNPPLAGLTGLQKEMAEFSLTIDITDPDSAPADMLNRAIWHSVKGFDTPYNYGRPIRRQHSSFESLLLLRLATGN